jgi:hypothetical protein
MLAAGILKLTIGQIGGTPCGLVRNEPDRRVSSRAATGLADTGRCAGDDY